MLRALVLVSIAALLSSCGGQSQNVATTDEVEAAFREHDIELFDSNLFDDNDDVQALYYGSHPSRDPSETILFVAVFADEESAQTYAVPEASPLADSGDVDRARNVVLYLKHDLAAPALPAARRALAALK